MARCLPTAERKGKTAGDVLYTTGSKFLPTFCLKFLSTFCLKFLPSKVRTPVMLFRRGHQNVLNVLLACVSLAACAQYKDAQSGDLQLKNNGYQPVSPYLS
jgi:hypothetical protein